MPARLPAGTVTFLLTDIEGSTRLWEEHPRAMRPVLARHDALATACITRYGGTVVKGRGEGDSLFAVFARATDALAAACELQKGLLAEPWPTGIAIQVRVALHTGEVALRDGDYYGPAVNRCARLRAMAHGGQVVLSQATEQLVRDELPEGMRLKPLGEHRLRDLERPEQVFQVLHPDLPADFPPLRSGAAQADSASAPLWRIELFGGLRMRRGDQILTRLETRKAEALIAYLALFPRRAHPRDTLAERLWPGEDPEATRNRLRQTLSTVRRALEPPPTPPGSVVQADRSDVRLDMHAVTTDVTHFETALQEAEKGASTAEQISAWKRAVELYGGELLTGCDEEWVLAERQRLEEAYIEALTRLADILAAEGDLGGAIAYARRAVNTDPLREPAHCVLMRVYGAADRISDALRQYRELERVLRQDLDSAPSSAARELLQQLQSMDGSPAPAAPPSPAAPPPDASSSRASAAPVGRIQAHVPTGTRLSTSRKLAPVLLALVVLTGVFLALWSSGERRDRARNRALAIHAASPEVEALYNRGRRAWNLRTHQDFRRALDFFQQAIEKDPQYAAAYSGLADTYSLLGYYGHMPPREARFQAESAIQEAERRNPDLPEVLTSQAWIAMTFEWDWIKAEKLFLKARNRNYATAHQWYSFLLMAQRETQKSLDEIHKAVDMEPRSSVIAKSVGQRYFHAGAHRPQFLTQAVEEFRKVLPGDDTGLTHYWLGLAYEQQALLAQKEGEARTAFTQALGALERARALSEDQDIDPAVLAALGHVHAASGDRDRAEQILGQLTDLQEERYVSPVTLAVLYTGLGKEAEALALLERAVQEGSPDLTLLQVEPRFTPLRSSSSLENRRRLDRIETKVFSQ